MEIPLITEEPNNYELTPETLSNMFVLTNMNTKESIKLYKQLGGPEQLLRYLSSSLIVIYIFINNSKFSTESIPVILSRQI